MNWFYQFFNFRKVIGILTVQLFAAEGKIVELEQAIRCRDHALASLATPPVETVVSREPIKLRRRTYAEEAQFFERQNSARWRDLEKQRQQQVAK
jgi:hypothetical protein